MDKLSFNTRIERRRILQMPDWMFSKNPFRIKLSLLESAVFTVLIAHIIIIHIITDFEMAQRP